jgi:hypothetical protein
MDTSALTSDFNNYFHAFKAPIFRPELKSSDNSENSAGVRGLVESSSSSSENGVRLS